MKLLATVSNADNFLSSTTTTPYEWWSLIIAALAVFLSIAIPVTQFLIKKFKRLKISIIPFEQTALTMLFNESGSYIKLLICLECKNQDTTIKKIHVNIIRDCDNQSCALEWSTLESIYVNWFGANTSNRINSVSYARPFKIKADTLEPFIIEFSGNGSIALKDFCIKRNKQLQRFIQFSNQKFETPDDVCKKYKAVSSEYTEMVSELSEYFFWKAGTYTIKIDILHDLNKTTSSKFSFVLSDDESKLLEKNIDSTIFGRLYENTPIPMIFNVVNKPLS